VTLPINPFRTISAAFLNGLCERCHDPVCQMRLFFWTAFTIACCSAIVRASGLYQIDRVFAASLCIIMLAGLLDRMACGIQEEKLLLARAFGLPQSLRARSRLLAKREASHL